MTKNEYEAWVQEHGYTPTWAPGHTERRPGVNRPYQYGDPHEYAPDTAVS